MCCPTSSVWAREIGGGYQPLAATVAPEKVADAFRGTKADNVDYLEGIVDEVAVFSVALSEADIKTIMTVGLEKAFAGEIAVSSSCKLNATWAHIKSR